MADWTTNPNAPYIQDQKTTSGIDWGSFYDGITPAAPSSAAPSPAYQPSYATPAQVAAMKAVPANSYQTPAATPLYIPGQPYGYSYPDTGDKGRATGAMTQQLAVGPGIRPSWTLPATVQQASWGPYEQAYYDAANKPGTWMAQSRMQAQALMRQMALRQGNNLTAPLKPPPKMSLIELLTGPAKTRGGGLAALAGQPAAPPNPYQTPEYLQTKAYKDAYKSSSGNVQGVSQYGRFYDLDRNEWVDTTKTPVKQKGSGGQSQSLLYNAGLGDGEAA